MPLSRKQYAVLNVAKAQLHLDDDNYRAILKQAAGVESARDLDWRGFKSVMDRFDQLGFKSDWRKRTFGDRPGMATPSQIETIRKMWGDYTGSDDEAALGAWLTRTCKVSALRFLDADAAHKAINGLRAMTARKRALESV